MISSDEYVKLTQDGITLCPNCSCTGNFYFDAFDSDASARVSQLLVCEQCGASWTDRYVLTGYTDLELVA